MIIDTAGLHPQGKFLMTCSAVPEESSRGGYVFWDFQFETELEGQPSTYRESVPIWLTAPIWKALGFKEITPGRFEVDPPAALGRRFACEVVHEDVKGTPRARMRNFSPAVQAPRGATQEADADSIPF